jgi:hypothetical protein
MLASCIAFRRRHDRPWILALWLTLAANTSVHAALATLILVFVWACDFLDDRQRSALLRPASLISIAIVLAGIAFALRSSMPTSDMAWALSGKRIEFAAVLQAALSDPGLSLAGVSGAAITATSEYPWRLLHTDGVVISRILVDATLLWLLWCLRNRRIHLVAAILTIVAFAVFFRFVYSASLRHEGVVAFVLFSICWIAADAEGEVESERRRIALGLLPLFALQTLALPVLANRSITKTESASKAFGRFIRSHDEYRNAILMSEPDYLMEALPYYVPNRVYMPRQNEFHYRVYFDRGDKRLRDLTLTRLFAVADSVGCVYRVPVLVAIGYTEIAWKKSGSREISYSQATFKWTEPEWNALRRLVKPVASFDRATSDEYYHVFEANPAADGRCRSSR